MNNNMLKISEAASMALHTALILAARKDEILANGDIAKHLGVSENHLSKVLQRLSKVGIVKSVRGPSGGFSLGKDPADISLLDVYEAIDGPIALTNCMLKKPVCNGEFCMLGAMLKNINTTVKDYFAGTKLSDLTAKNDWYSWREEEAPCKKEK